MHVSLVIALGPCEPDRVARAELRRRVRESLPIPALGGGWVYHHQPAVTLESTGNQEPVLACGSLTRERTTPRSTAPERVPIWEVGQMAADLDPLAVQCGEDHLA